MNTHILQTQLAACAAAAYPLHMPGHKRRVDPAPGLPAGWDLTEVPGADDLHDAGGILAEAMARTAALWGAQRSWYLVNGSTCGLLAAVRAAVPFGGRVVCARNCHKAVYHAIELNHLEARWLLPPVDPAFGVYGSVPPGDVAAALDAAPGAALVILTSPTYEGVVSDVRSIAEICHTRGVPLLVDEAHGAHYLPAAAPYGWRGGAVAAGADLVVQSPHKTLPSLTQTALLHLGGGRVDPAAVERELDVFETSSPSYPLLASLDGCTGLMAAHGAAWFAAHRARLDRFDAAAAGLKRLRLLCHGGDRLADHPGFFGFDAAKITVGAAGAGLTGTALAGRLREEYGLETEMSCGYNLLAISTVCDAPDALDRLGAALAEIDAGTANEKGGDAPCAPAALLPPPGEARCTIAEALARPREILPPDEAAGRTAAEYVWAYPPGVPLLAPGEAVTPAFLAAHAALSAAGTRLVHTGGPGGGFCVTATGGGG